MDSLRERIDQEVYEAYQAGIDHNQVPFKYPAMGKSEVQEATERIIAAFVGALLSDEAVEAAAQEWWNCHKWGQRNPGVQNHGKIIATDMLIAALKAIGATGGEGTDE